MNRLRMSPTAPLALSAACSSVVMKPDCTSTESRRHRAHAEADRPARAVRAPSTLAIVGSCSSATRVAAWPRIAGTGRSVAAPFAERANSSAVLLVRAEGAADVHGAVEEHDLDALVPERRKAARDGAHRPAPGDADQRHGAERGDELRRRLCDAVERQRLVVVRRLAHHHGFPQAEAPLQAALEDRDCAPCAARSRCARCRIRARR